MLYQLIQSEVQILRQLISELYMIETLIEQFGRLLWDYFGPMVSLSFLLLLSAILSLIYNVFHYFNSKLLKQRLGVLEERVQLSEERRAAIQEMRTLMEDAVGAQRLSLIDGIHNGNQSTILLVEDEKLLHHLYKPAIETAFPQAQVRLANNGAEAWAEIQRKRPSLVIMDIFMPVMNGFELFQKLSLHQPQIPVLAISGYVEGAEVAAKINAPLSRFEFLRKPFLLADLIKAIGQLTDAKLREDNDHSIAA
jgi:CheY-like chemotaxis protein